MSNTFIHPTAIIKDCSYTVLKAYRNAALSHSHFGDNCTIGDDTTIERTELEGCNAINRRSYINDSTIGAFTYTGINTTINYSKIGRFCSIGRNVDIGGFDHDFHKITTMSIERFDQLAGINSKGINNNKNTLCSIGNDVWIAAGAQVLHSASIGNGAVIGAGAVVTHNIPPFAIAVGVPAKVIGFRCEEDIINRLQELNWWDLSITKLKRYGEELTSLELCEESLHWLESISKEQD